MGLICAFIEKLGNGRLGILTHKICLVSEDSAFDDFWGCSFFFVLRLCWFVF
jgi:hypothetical protein